MKIPLRILHLEDNRTDAELLGLMLKDEGIDCEITCVRKRSDYEAALLEETFDLIISDFSIPQFDGLAALKMAQERHPETPFIFVSGTMGEEAAVESLKRGATDYVLKDRLARLASAVERALREAREQANKKKLEAQFLRAQRLQTIGALAGGIAHDLNNALSPILMGIELLREDLPAAMRESMLNTMQGSAKRGSDMIRQIMAFARGVSGEPDMLDVARVVSEINKLVRDTFPRSIQIQTKIANDLFPVLGNATQLHQVLLNLCVNARDAMTDGGVLEIEAANIQLENRTTPWQTEPVSGAYVVLTVSDSGHGMSDEVMAQIFEPFFTTKEMGKGTGLGLSTVQGIVKSHDGFLEVASQAGKGTCFKVFLPAARGARTQQTEAGQRHCRQGTGNKF